MTLRFSLRELEVFCAIARHGGVHRAAEAVARTQSAASQSLARLERGLGQALFDRRGRQLVLNARGRALLPRAQALLDAARELQGSWDNAPPALHLAASSTIARYVLPPLLAAYRLQYPAAVLEVQSGNTAEVSAAVDAMAVDFGLIEGPCHRSGLLVEPWREDALVLIAPPGHALTHGVAGRVQLAAAPWLLREPGSGTRKEVDQWLRSSIGCITPDMELGDSGMIWRAVAAGAGISCLPRVVVAEALQQGAVMEIHSKPAPPKRMFSLLRHPARAPTRGLQALLALA